MPYATPEDLRAEGVTDAMASDARLTRLIEEATATIDRLTGWFFEPRLQRYRLDGRGSPGLELPAPPIRLDRALIGAAALDLDDLIVLGAPVQPGFDVGGVIRRSSVFPRGRANITLEGLFGYTLPDGSPHGATPPDIRRACMLLVLRWLDPLASAASMDARSRHRLLEERTRDQSYKLDRPSASAHLTGEPDADALVLRYLRPRPMGAA